VYFPSGHSPELVQAGLSSFVAQSVSHHGTWRTRNVAMLPVTLAMGLLPGPNVRLCGTRARVCCEHGRWAALI
jgi:hypothetical protein